MAGCFDSASAPPAAAMARSTSVRVSTCCGATGGGSARKSIALAHHRTRTIGPRTIRTSHCSGRTGGAGRKPGATYYASLRTQMFIEELDGALPGELRGLLVVARRRVVVEAVLRAGVHVHCVRHARRFERRFELRPARV